LNICSKNWNWAFATEKRRTKEERSERRIRVMIDAGIGFDDMAVCVWVLEVVGRRFEAR